MSLIICNAAEKIILDDILAMGTFTYKLYKNDVTPSATSVGGDFTIADFPGYANVAATGWSAAITNAGGKAESTATDITWEATGSSSNQIYGYCVFNGSTYLFAERFGGAPYGMVALGSTLTVTPMFTYRSEF